MNQSQTEELQINLKGQSFLIQSIDTVLHLTLLYFCFEEFGLSGNLKGQSLLIQLY